MATFSRVLYHALDHLGYNDNIVKFRRECWKYYAELYNKYLSNRVSKMITAGSKGEGITAVLESDLDIIHILNSVLCINTAEQLPSQLPHHIDSVFVADMENVPPGYTRLKLHRPSSFRNVRDQRLRSCLFQTESGEFYLSSTFMAASHKEGIERVSGGGICHDVTGPATPIFGSSISIDCVIGFTCHCPQLLQTWASRPRKHEWPSRDTVQTARSFLPQVVPVGAKGSDRQFQEWRFCFIESELTLTHSFNGTQIKLYILLKTIAKNILKQVTGEISSYIMKNITYWLSELLPLHVFREEKLVSLVLLALAFLRKAIIKWNTLPYYMIPSRNLLSERLEESTRRELSDVLYRLLEEGPRLFLRIEKIRKCLETASRSPMDIVTYGNMRDKVEQYNIAKLLLKLFRGLGGRVDESIISNLEFSYASLILQRLFTLYPSGRFSEDEMHQTRIEMLSSK